MAEQTRSVVVAEFEDGIQPVGYVDPQPTQQIGPAQRAPEAAVRLLATPKRRAEKFLVPESWARP
jgi:hypothetical protein